MPSETENAVIFAGRPMTLVGPRLNVGDVAPDFEGIAPDLSPRSLSSIQIPLKIISSVPSLDTGVCSAQTRRFEGEIAKLGGQAALVTVSMDLPFAQGRFCSNAPPANAYFISDSRNARFGPAYGTLIKEVRLLCRAVFVVGKDGKLAHVQYVKETGTHPDYEAALAAVQAALKK